MSYSDIAVALATIRTLTGTQRGTLEDTVEAVRKLNTAALSARSFPEDWRIADAAAMAQLRWSVHVMGGLEVEYNQRDLWAKTLHDLRRTIYRMEKTRG